MFAGKKCGRLAIALSLAVVIVANGAPAVSSCDEGFVAGAWSANTDEHITFSPAFIFSNLARGPPESA